MTQFTASLNSKFESYSTLFIVLWKCLQAPQTHASISRNCPDTKVLGSVFFIWFDFLCPCLLTITKTSIKSNPICHILMKNICHWLLLWWEKYVDVPLHRLEVAWGDWFHLSWYKWRWIFILILKSWTKCFPLLTLYVILHSLPLCVFFSILLVLPSFSPLFGDLHMTQLMKHGLSVNIVSLWQQQHNIPLVFCPPVFCFFVPQVVGGFKEQVLFSFFSL